MHTFRIVLGATVALLLTACNTAPAAGPTVAPTAPQPKPAAAPSPAPPVVSSPLPLASPVAQASPAAAPAQEADPRQAVTRALASLASANSFRFEGSVEEGGELQQVSGAFVPPNALSISTPQGELRVLPNAMYVREPGGQWIGIRLGTEEAGGMQIPFDPTEIARELDDAGNFQRVGTEVIDGTPTTIYSYTEQEGDQQLTTRVWVSNAEGLPLRMETRQGDNVVANFRFTDFGEVEPITAPEDAQVLDLSELEKALPSGEPKP